MSVNFDLLEVHQDNLGRGFNRSIIIFSMGNL